MNHTSAPVLRNWPRYARLSAEHATRELPAVPVNVPHEGVWNTATGPAVARRGVRRSIGRGHRI